VARGYRPQLRRLTWRNAITGVALALAGLLLIIASHLDVSSGRTSMGRVNASRYQVNSYGHDQGRGRLGRWIRRLAGIVLAAALVAACGAPHAAGSSAPTPTASPVGSGPALSTPAAAAPSGTAAALPAGTTIRITKPTQGRLVRLHLGDRLVVALSPKRRWSISVADETMLVPLPVSALPRGAQAGFEVVGPGVTSLFANDVTPCRDRCTPAPDSFEVAVAVP
jgi:hypothetical protein